LLIGAGKIINLNFHSFSISFILFNYSPVIGDKRVKYNESSFLLSGDQVEVSIGGYWQF
jgi:hypothetical protein